MTRKHAPTPTRLAALALAILAIAPVLAPGQEAAVADRRTRDASNLRGMTSAVYDDAGLFGREAVDQAESALKGIEKEFGVPTTVETIASLKGEPVEAATVRHALKSGVRGVYLLISKDDHKYDLIISREFRGRPGMSGNNSLPARVNAALRDEFPKGQFDAGLNRVVDSIYKGLEAGERDATRKPGDALRGGYPGASSEAARMGPKVDGMVLRNRVGLSLAGARKVVEAAEAKAGQMNVKVNVAVVDDGGHLLAFARMDGARPASAATATTKAVSSATYRQPTGPVPDGADKPDLVVSLGISAAAASGGARVTTLLGGIPIEVDGQVIGAVGVGGGTGEQDAAVARAGVDAFLAALPPEPKADPKTP